MAGMGDRDGGRRRFLIRTGGQGSDAPVPAPQAPVEIPDGIAILHRSATHAAPEAVTFSARPEALAPFDLSGPEPGGVYDPRLHDLGFFWSFGDDYPYRAPENMPGMFKFSGEALGPVAAHVYRAPGDYRVVLDIYGMVSGRLVHGRSETTLSVGDPHEIFGGNRTFFVSPSSDWRHAPAGAMQYQSLDRACVHANTSRRGEHYRIMLNRGEAHDFAGYRIGFNTPRGPTLHIVAGPGDAEKPLVRCAGGFSAGANDDEGYDRRDLVFQNLVLAGALDSAAGDHPGDFPDAVSCMEISPHMLLMDGCEVGGFTHCLYLHNAERTAHRAVHVNDCVFTNYGQWGVLGGSFAVFAATGSRIMSAPDAQIDNGSNGGGTLRLGGAGEIALIQSCDIFCRQGWSPHGDYIATQPCARLNSDGFQGAFVGVARSSLESGMTVLSIGASDHDSHASNVIVESCYLLGSYQTTELIGTSIGGVTIRNNIMVMPDSLRLESTNLPRAFVRTSAQGEDALNRASPIRVFCNTMVNLLSAPMPAVSDEGGFAVLLDENNVLFQNEGGDRLALSLGPPLWAPRERGYRSSTVALYPGTETSAEAVAPYRLSGAAPAGAARAGGLFALFDYGGGLRGTPPLGGAH